jgi:hypothetical protein
MVWQNRVDFYIDGVQADDQRKRLVPHGVQNTDCPLNHPFQVESLLKSASVGFVDAK